jgi:hypothetical protein
METTSPDNLSRRQIMKRQPLILLLALLLATSAALAQPADTIVQNPKAVKLHKIWMVRGSTLGGDEVGTGAGGLGDIFGTGEYLLSLFDDNNALITTTAVIKQ